MTSIVKVPYGMLRCSARAFPLPVSMKSTPPSRSVRYASMFFARSAFQSFPQYPERSPHAQAPTPVAETERSLRPSVTLSAVVVVEVDSARTTTTRAWAAREEEAEVEAPRRSDVAELPKIAEAADIMRGWAVQALTRIARATRKMTEREEKRRFVATTYFRRYDNCSAVGVTWTAEQYALRVSREWRTEVLRRVGTITFFFLPSPAPHPHLVSIQKKNVRLLKICAFACKKYILL